MSNGKTYRFRGEPLDISSALAGASLDVIAQGRDTYLMVSDSGAVTASGVKTASGLWIHCEGTTYFIEEVKAQARRRNGSGQSAGGDILSPMPGKILRLAVVLGDIVAKGDLLCILEAMKMEHRLVAPAGGKVVEVFVSEGEIVAAGKRLVDVE